MAKLVVQPGSPAAWEIKLKAGTNSLGRNPANDFKLDDPSVSGSHCEIRLENENAVIKDLGSTNGTFVNRAPVTEAAIEKGEDHFY
jgi:pSer/pThr/pTyr-binding forkhead associated (FHA) protein